MFEKTLEQLEGDVWPNDEFGSHLTKTCHLLRKKPIDDFTVEDLRIMISQGIGLPYLLPEALEILEQNPAAEGDFYPGDLLISAIRVDRSFLVANPKIVERLRSVAQRFNAMHPSAGGISSEVDLFLSNRAV